MLGEAVFGCAGRASVAGVAGVATWPLGSLWFSARASNVGSKGRGEGEGALTGRFRQYYDFMYSIFLRVQNSYQT